MRIERGEHMSYPPKFEDIEARPPRLSSRWRAGMAVGPRVNSQDQQKKDNHEWFTLLNRGSIREI